MRLAVVQKPLASQPRGPLGLLRHPGAAATASEPRLTLDAMRPLDEIAERATAYIAGRCAVATGSRP